MKSETHAPNVLNEIVGAFKNQKPLMFAWKSLPARVRKMVERDILGHLEKFKADCRKEVDDEYIEKLVSESDQPPLPIELDQKPIPVPKEPPKVTNLGVKQKPKKRTFKSFKSLTED